MADFEESYLVKGSALARIGRVTREVETNLGLKPPEHRRKRIPAKILEGVFLERLLGTSDPNSPTTAQFQIKTAVRATNGWEDEDSPSIIPVLNRTTNEYLEGFPATVIEIYANKYFVIGGGGGSVNLIHGIVHACLGEGYYEVEISEWSGRTPNQESSGSSSCNVCSFVAPAGSSSGGCAEDPPLPDFTDSDSEEDNVIKRQTTGTGVIVLAYDPGSIFIPLVVGSDCRMANTGEENPTVGTEDDSQSSGNTEPVYQIVRGHQEHLKLYREVWDCCNGQDTLISRKAIIFPGVECPEEVCTVCE